MSEWRKETRSDLSDAAAMIEAALKSLSGEPSRDELLNVWLAYVKVEKSIAFIRLEIGEENPGRFIKLGRYKVPDERQALRFALKSLTKGSDDFAVGDFLQALRNLRESRNYLRALLREKRLARNRRFRAG